LIELAKFFSCNRDSLKRSMVFIAFSAEELGLMGASHYVDNPKVPLEKTVAMLNMDMIGRLHKNKLTIFGVG
ncbi:MAG: M28 family peptidase, partial [Aliifodinibius sp.]|nr:M28 family peptidase [Fodinibius sp.]NIY27881.1 M28 family peptidase [Fodinibius sp.]